MRIPALPLPEERPNSPAKDGIKQGEQWTDSAQRFGPLSDRPRAGTDPGVYVIPGPAAPVEALANRPRGVSDDGGFSSQSAISPLMRSALAASRDEGDQQHLPATYDAGSNAQQEESVREDVEQGLMPMLYYGTGSNAAQRTRNATSEGVLLPGSSSSVGGPLVVGGMTTPSDHETRLAEESIRSIVAQVVDSDEDEEGEDDAADDVDFDGMVGSPSFARKMQQTTELLRENERVIEEIKRNLQHRVEGELETVGDQDDHGLKRTLSGSLQRVDLAFQKMDRALDRTVPMTGGGGTTRSSPKKIAWSSAETENATSGGQRERTRSDVSFRSSVASDQQHPAIVSQQALKRLMAPLEVEDEGVALAPRDPMRGWTDRRASGSAGVAAGGEGMVALTIPQGTSSAEKILLCERLLQESLTGVTAGVRKMADDSNDDAGVSETEDEAALILVSPVGSSPERPRRPHNTPAPAAYGGFEDTPVVTDDRAASSHSGLDCSTKPNPAQEFFRNSNFLRLESPKSSASEVDRPRSYAPPQTQIHDPARPPSAPPSGGRTPAPHDPRGRARPRAELKEPPPQPSVVERADAFGDRTRSPKGRRRLQDAAALQTELDLLCSDLLSGRGFAE